MARRWASPRRVPLSARHYGLFSEGFALSHVRGLAGCLRSIAAQTCPWTRAIRSSADWPVVHRKPHSARRFVAADTWLLRSWVKAVLLPLPPKKRCSFEDSGERAQVRQFLVASCPWAAKPCYAEWAQLFYGTSPCCGFPLLQQSRR